MTQSVKVEGFDRVYPLVGGGGLYQWLLFTLCSLQAMTISFHHLGYVFLGAVPDHWCEINDLKNSTWTNDEIKNLSIPRKTTDTSKWESCSYYDLDYKSLSTEPNFETAYNNVNYSNVVTKSCSKWDYDTSIYESTVATYFDLVCDRRYLVATIQATYMSGVFVGSLVMGALSDNVLGRRKTIIVSECLIIIFGFAASFAKSYTTFVAARFFIAIGATGSFQNTFSLLMEFCDTGNRATIGLVSNIPFAIGYMILPFYAYHIRNWTNLQLAFSISTLVLISYFWLLPSSPRWLALKGREQEALKILNRVAKINRKPKPHRLELMVILESCEDEKILNQSNISVIGSIFQTFKNIGNGYVNIVRNRELRKRSFLIWFLFISVTLVYYGLSFDTSLITRDPFILVFLGGLVELPGYLIVVPMATKCGRTPTVASTFFITGIVCLIAVIIPQNYDTLRVFFTMVGKLFISGAFAVIYLLAAELYPTSERVTGLGCASLMGRFGAIASPYIVDMTRTVYSDLPRIIFSVTGIIAGLVTLFLPETKDTELLDSMRNLERQASIIEGNAPITKIVRRFSQPRVDSSISNPQNDSTEVHNV